MPSFLANQRPRFSRLRQIPALVFLAVFAGGFGSAFAAEPPSESELAWFESKIRPVLVEHCYKCHSAKSKSLKGGLQLDTRDGIRKGGESGPAVVPGEVDESLLISALRHDGFEMPPKEKLPEAVVSNFVRWVEMGAPDPRDGQALIARGGIDLQAGREFWAFQPPRRVAPPEVKQTGWPESDVDRFVLIALEAKGIGPVADADRRALIRRVYFDLVGLPPEPAEIAAFLADDSPTALATLVDRLLDSPHFGERWGRHWLDVARYADSTGGGRSKIFAEAWRYRDYVIASLNRDKPFNRFVAEQIAGDLLPAENTAQAGEQLTATAFLALGAHNYENQDKELLRMEVVDEQIDTMGRTILAMTLGCARCHDHKFDPIPTTDYYALAGIFRSTKSLVPGNVSSFVTRPLPRDETKSQLANSQAKQISDLKQQLTAAQAVLAKLQPAKKSKQPLAPLVGIVLDDTQAEVKGEWKNSTFHPRYLGRGYLHDDNAGKGEKSVTFRPDLPESSVYEVRIASTPGTNRDAKVPVTIEHDGGETTVTLNQRAVPPIDELFHSLGRFSFAKGTAGSVTVSNRGTTGHVIVDGVQFIPARLFAKSGQTPLPADAAKTKPAPAVGKAELAAAAKRVQQLEKKLKAAQAKAPPAPKTMAVIDEASPGDWHVHIRGGIRNLGPKVPRGFVSVAYQGEPPKLAAKESGRRELATWLASRDNPLTARVYVNRIWHHLFGAGLVRTVDNFGTMGERPSHPQLLDYLAVRFMDENWSTKRLIRQIVLSRVYRLSTAGSDRSAAVDPENRLLWRMNRRRLDAESIRDAVLTVSGRLDTSMGGFTVKQSVAKKEYDYKFDTVRRSVYVPVLRNAMLELFDVFDFADPNQSAGRRTVSTLPTQALYVMNSPFIMDESRAAAARLLAIEGLDESQRLDLAYELTLGRPPRDGERERTLQYLHQSATPADGDQQPSAEQVQQAWSGVFHSLFACIDFRYLN